KWKRQSSSPMLPSAAEMPPCAATVCERVGKTLVMHAVFRPLCASPKVARRPAPPAPTTIMSDWCSVMGYDDVIAGSRGKGDAGNHIQRRDGAQPAEEVVEEVRGDLERTRMHVILDHDLQAELGMPEHADQEHREDDGVPGPRNDAAGRFQVRAHQRDQRPDEPDRQRREHDRGDPLRPEVAGARLARAKPARALERRAELRGARSFSTTAHDAPLMPKNQISAVSTKPTTNTA